MLLTSPRDNIPVPVPGKHNRQNTGKTQGKTVKNSPPTKMHFYQQLRGFSRLEHRKGILSPGAGISWMRTFPPICGISPIRVDVFPLSGI